MSIAATGPLLFQADSQSAQPIPQVDQSVLPPSPIYTIAVSGNQSIGQTFTVSLPGYLTRVDLPLARQATAVAPFQFELRKVSAGLPDLSPQGLLYSTSIDSSAVPVGNFPSTFTLSVTLGGSGIPVAAGDGLAIVCSTAGDWYHWASWNQYDLYALGTTAWRPTSRTYFVALSGTDSGFQTWVVIPEPSHLFVWGLCVAVLVPRLRVSAGRCWQGAYSLQPASTV